ncbi:hypothetical protein Y032_0002g670 [Ancylostoma ceylanicum]|uniref:Uncharacterized protein n=1 Tax=Ancylostoma ceylanicum TaxID=53326 RepID=A0A016W1Q0_9BILA|nr:hypothetical protein Y032_0002g670 [Ancylostoma ceylanicum]
MAVTRLRPRTERGATAPLTLESSPQWLVWVFLIRILARAARSPRVLLEAADESPPLTPTVCTVVPKKKLAFGINRSSAEPQRACYALSYVLRRGSVDAQCSGRQVFFGKSICVTLC